MATTPAAAPAAAAAAAAGRPPPRWGVGGGGSRVSPLPSPGAAPSPPPRVGLRLLAYTSLPALLPSDHKPVAACFELSLPPPLPARPAREGFRGGEAGEGVSHGSCSVQ